MKKTMIIKSFSLTLALVLAISIRYVLAQSEATGSTAVDVAEMPIELVGIDTKEEKIQYFEQRKSAFLEKGNTAAADYCSQVIELLKAKLDFSHLSSSGSHKK